MLIIISPAKQMAAEDYGLPPRQLPFFAGRAAALAQRLSQLSLVQLEALYKSSPAIAKENYLRLQHFHAEDLPTLTPALFAYRGLQYQSMGAQVLSAAQYAYLERHLIILSALYGALRPFDGVQPYRLEMGARFEPEPGTDLYHYWRADITAYLKERACQEHLPTDDKGRPRLLNLASAEYAKAVDLACFDCTEVRFYLPDGQGRLKERGAWCKKARGALCAYAAERKAQDSAELTEFNAFGFKYSEELSAERRLVFVKEG